jgi:hypothetical protein
MLALSLPSWLSFPLLLVKGVLWLGVYRHGIDAEIFKRVDDGMTAKQVLAAVGVPPGDYTIGRVLFMGSSTRDRIDPGLIARLGTVSEHKADLRKNPPVRTQQWWYTNRGALCVIYDHNMKVDLAIVYGAYLDDRHGLTHMLIRLGLADGEVAGLRK